MTLPDPSISPPNPLPASTPLLLTMYSTSIQECSQVHDKDLGTISIKHQELSTLKSSECLVSIAKGPLRSSFDGLYKKLTEVQDGQGTHAWRKNAPGAFL